MAWVKRRPLTGLLMAAILTAGTTVSPPAHAENIGLDGLEALVYVVATIVLVDVGALAYDSVQAARGKLPGRAYSVVEIVWSAPQALAGAAFLGSSSRDEMPLGIVYTAWTATLTAHGFWGATVSQGSEGAGASTSSALSTSSVHSGHVPGARGGPMWGFGLRTSF